MKRFRGAIPLKSALLGCLLSTVITQSAVSQSLRQSEAPNVVLIVADDLGWGSVGYNGSFVRTPNIDRLASEGVQLTRFYVSPMCSPTRAGLLTGRHPMRYGMARTVVRPWMVYGLPPEELTLPEALAEAGYRHRGAFGKWHLGHLDPVWHPLSQGFTEFRGQYNGAADYWTRVRMDEQDWHQNWTPLTEGGYTTDLIADAACSFIRRRTGDGPFFCYVPFTAPHDPFQAPDSYVAAYAEQTEVGPDKDARDRQILAGMVTCMDDGVGRILRTLQETGADRRTLVWFLSDNGGITRLGLNGRLRDGKLTVYEGGIRVPSALWWPGVIEGGRKISEPLTNHDVMPTLLRLAGYEGALPKPLDGVDVSDLLAGRSSSLPARDLYFFHGQSGLQREQIAIRSAEGWKMVVLGPDVRRPGGYATSQHQVELFRLADDPAEENDLAARHPEMVEELGQKLIAFRQTEPPGAMATANQPPRGFKPPAQWQNRPAEAREPEGRLSEPD